MLILVDMLTAFMKHGKYFSITVLYSLLQNPWRERPFGSRPRNFLPGTPPNARRRHFRYIEGISRYIDINSHYNQIVIIVK